MKNILLISSGFTPQVITETIYYYNSLYKPSFLFDEVHVVTDLRGSEKIERTLFGKDGAIVNLYKDYDIDSKSIRFDKNCVHIIKDKEDVMLNDIRSVKDNKSTINQVFQLVQKFTSIDDTTLYTSVAGGRKSMSVIVGQAMQFFGRDQDKLIHVLVDDILFSTTARDFYYPTPYKKELIIDGKKIDISKLEVNVHEIPYVRLRYVLGDILHNTNKNSLLDIVKVAQQKIDDTFGPIQLNVNYKDALLIVNQYKIPMPAKNLSLYATFLLDSIGNRFLTLDEILSRNFLEKYLENYKKIKGPKNILYQREKNRLFNSEVLDNFYSKEWLMESKSKINRILKNNLPNYLYASILINTKGPYGERRYGISFH